MLSNIQTESNPLIALAFFIVHGNDLQFLMGQGIISILNFALNFDVTFQFEISIPSVKGRILLTRLCKEKIFFGLCSFLVSLTIVMSIQIKWIIMRCFSKNTKKCYIFPSFYIYFQFYWMLFLVEFFWHSKLRKTLNIMFTCCYSKF